MRAVFHSDTGFQKAEGDGHEGQGNGKKDTSGKHQTANQHGQRKDEQHRGGNFCCAPGDPEEQPQGLETQLAETYDHKNLNHGNTSFESSIADILGKMWNICNTFAPTPVWGSKRAENVVY